MRSFATCVHEASHAVAAHAGKLHLMGATVREGEPAQVWTGHHDQTPRLAIGAMALAGAIGESKYSGRGEPSDEDEFNFAQAAKGQPASFRSDCEAEATRILQEQWPCVLAVARALKRNQMLTGVQIIEIIQATEPEAAGVYI